MKKEIKSGMIFSLTSLVVFGLVGLTYASITSLKVSSGELLTSEKWNSLVPVGSIQMYAGNSAPVGYLLLDGSEVARTTYSDLFSVIGTSYGSNSSTTFTLPNLQDKFPMGKSTSNNLGDMGGNSSVNLSHNHNLLHVNPGYCKSGVYLYRDTTSCSGYGWNSLNMTTTSKLSSIDITNPYTVVNYIIKY